MSYSQEFRMFLALSVASTIAFFGFSIWSMKSVRPQEVPSLVRAGKAVWQKYGCVECHTILGNGGYSAVDLTDETTRRDEVWLEDFFLSPPVMRPHARRRHPGLDWSETLAMIAYLRYLNSIQVKGWPPPAQTRAPLEPHQ